MLPSLFLIRLINFAYLESLSIILLIVKTRHLLSFAKLLDSANPLLWNPLLWGIYFVALLKYIDKLKPGVTGWAQINGRNAISWEEKFILDVWYVENCSLWLDLKIFLLSIKYVLSRQGINQDDEETMPHFLGNKNKGLD